MLLYKCGDRFFKCKPRGTELEIFQVNTFMKTSLLYTFIISCLLTLQSCEVVGGIFKAGMVWGIILVVLVIVGIIALITRSKK